MMPVGFGFLTFDIEEAVEKAVKEHFVDLDGKKVKTNRLVSVSWLGVYQAMAPLGLVKKMAFLLLNMIGNSNSARRHHGGPHYN